MGNRRVTSEKESAQMSDNTRWVRSEEVQVAGSYWLSCAGGKPELVSVAIGEKGPLVIYDNGAMAEMVGNWWWQHIPEPQPPASDK